MFPSHFYFKWPQSLLLRTTGNVLNLAIWKTSRLCYHLNCYVLNSLSLLSQSVLWSRFHIVTWLKASFPFLGSDVGDVQNRGRLNPASQTIALVDAVSTVSLAREVTSLASWAPSIWVTYHDRLWVRFLLNCLASDILEFLSFNRTLCCEIGYDYPMGFVLFYSTLPLTFMSSIISTGILFWYYAVIFYID